jgi:hypothetical protein
VFNLAPKKVIKALESYNAQSSAELSFRAGDYYYVIDEKEGRMYEVVNPIEKQRGLVYMDYFEEVRAHSGAFYPTPTSPVSPISLPRTMPREHKKRIDTDSMRRMVPMVEQPPTPPLESKARALQYRFQFADVQRVYVPECTIKDSKWVFTLQFQFLENNVVLYRNYGQIWDLHLQIMERYSEEAGYNGYPRIIPFLPSPAAMDANEANERKHHVAYYFERLLLIPSIQISDHLFFTLKENDIDPTQRISFDSSDALMDLIDGLEKEPHVRVTLMIGEEPIEWIESQMITYRHLVASIQDRLNFRFENILYKDELNNTIFISSDSIVRNLFQLSFVTLFVN